MLSEPVAVTLLVTTELENLGVPYLIGGSFASALHGVVRTTLDTDLVAELRPDQVEPKVQTDLLDLDYLRRWASDLRVTDLLEKALKLI